MSHWLEIKGTIDIPQKAGMSIRKIFNTAFKLTDDDTFISIHTINNGPNYFHKVNLSIRGLTGPTAAIRMDKFVLNLKAHKNCKVNLTSEIHWE